ncbi:MAG: hypothetical protein ACI81A_001847 [Paraglaciecola sp.]|jgi:hypothetical protein
MRNFVNIFILALSLGMSFSVVPQENNEVLMTD